MLLYFWIESGGRNDADIGRCCCRCWNKDGAGAVRGRTLLFYGILDPKASLVEKVQKDTATEPNAYFSFLVIALAHTQPHHCLGVSKRLEDSRR